MEHISISLDRVVEELSKKIKKKTNKFSKNEKRIKNTNPIKKQSDNAEYDYSKDNLINVFGE